MNTRTRRGRAAAVAVLLATTLGLSACSGSETKAPATGSLEAALKDQVAGKTDQAAAAYQALLAKDPRNKVAAYNLGLIAQNKGDVAEAKAKYEQALQADPAYVPALFNLAIVETGNNNKPVAESLYRRALAADDTDANTHLNLGFLLLDQGKKADGQAQLRRAAELSPDAAARIPGDLLK